MAWTPSLRPLCIICPQSCQSINENLYVFSKLCSPSQTCQLFIKHLYVFSKLCSYFQTSQLCSLSICMFSVFAPTPHPVNYLCSINICMFPIGLHWYSLFNICQGFPFLQLANNLFPSLLFKYISVLINRNIKIVFTEHIYFDFNYQHVTN